MSELSPSGAPLRSAPLLPPLPWRWLSAWLGAALLAVAGVKRFEPWEQVMDLWNSGVSPLLLAISGHPHFFRFMSAYPGFLLEEAYPGLGFSLYVALFFALNVTLWHRVAIQLTGRSPALLAWALFILPHLFMNGRGVLAWTGWLLAVHLCADRARGVPAGIKTLVYGTLACWIAAVSTGVFIVVAMALLLFAVQYRPRTRNRPWRRIALLMAALPILYGVASYFALAVTKTVEFYGGGLAGAVQMLEHGVGTVFFGSALLALGIVGVASVVLIVAFTVLTLGRHRLSALTKLLACTLVGGLFGFTVLTMALPLLLLYLRGGRWQLPAPTARAPAAL